MNIKYKRIVSKVENTMQEKKINAADAARSLGLKPTSYYDAKYKTKGKNGSDLKRKYVRKPKTDIVTLTPIKTENNAKDKRAFLFYGTPEAVAEIARNLV